MRTKRQVMGDVPFFIHTPLKMTGIQILKFLLEPLENFVDFFEEKIRTTLFENLSSLGWGL